MFDIPNISLETTWNTFWVFWKRCDIRSSVFPLVGFFGEHRCGGLGGLGWSVVEISTYWIKVLVKNQLVEEALFVFKIIFTLRSVQSLSNSKLPSPFSTKERARSCYLFSIKKGGVFCFAQRYFHFTFSWGCMLPNRGALFLFPFEPFLLLMFLKLSNI